MGKISVKYYLNKNVNPVYIGRERVEAYPLYYYITVRRKTIHKPSDILIYLPIGTNLETGELAEADKIGVRASVDMWGGMERVLECIKQESERVIGIVDIFEKDYEAKSVKSAYRMLSNRSFNSKDEYTNDLNAYIEFYREDLESLSTRDAKEQFKVVFDENIQEIRKRLGSFAYIIKVTPHDRISEEMIEIYEDIGDKQGTIVLYANHLIQLYNQNNKRDRMSVYSWIYGNGKELVWQNLEYEKSKANPKERNTHLEKVLQMSKEEFYGDIVQVIDRVCSVTDRIDKAYKYMMRGI